MDKSLILNKIKDHLKIVNDKDFATFLGIKQNTLSTWKSRNSIDYDLIISKCDFINGDWLLTGRGNMIISADQSQQPHIEDKENHLIPLYDTIATAGKSTVDMAPVLLPSEYIDAGDWFRDATAAMRVHGDSMYPEYHSGSIVAIKEVNKGLIVYGEDYVFETDDYRMLKRLQRGRDREHVLVASANTEKWDDGSDRGRLVHEPFDVHLDEIKRLFIVLGSVRRVHTSRIVYNHKSSK
ncbi:LexA family transcriptional regulator [Sphingobacterium multivorum]|uniref:LexA family transcriptional regulator n=1 Tax=Sphingobacterium multivorum TaxID=28454 RepID=UPI003DA68296